MHPSNDWILGVNSPEGTVVFKFIRQKKTKEESTSRLKLWVYRLSLFTQRSRKYMSGPGGGAERDKETAAASEKDVEKTFIHLTVFFFYIKKKRKKKCRVEDLAPSLACWTPAAIY